METKTTRQDLIDRLQAEFVRLAESVPEKLDRLHMAGGGVYEAHQLALSRGYPHLEVAKIEMAMLREYTEQCAQNKDKDFRADVLNYYLLL
jgi:hypothetical protein